MRLRTTFSALSLLVAAFAAADHNWNLKSSYEFAITGDVGASTLHDLEFVMEGGFKDSPDSGWGLTTSFEPGNSGTLSADFDTFPFYGRAASEPFLRESLFFGVIDDLPTDGSGPQKHLVLFMDPLAAARVQGAAYGTIFNTDNQSIQITEETLVEALETVHTDLSDEEKLPYYRTIYDFRDTVAREANVGVNGTRGSLWFSPGAFDIVTFSSGQTIGSGTNAFATRFSPVPEPASMLALGLGAAGFLRRRRQA